MSPAPPVSSVSSVSAAPAVLGEQLARLYRDGDFAGLEHTCLRVLAREPGRGDIFKILGVALAKQGKHPEALAAKQHACELLPDDAEAHANLANTLVQARRWHQAQRHLETATRLAPRQTGLWVSLAQCLRQLGCLTDAQAALRQALKLAPERADLHNDLGNTLREAGQMEASVAAFRAALALNPDMGEAWNNLGNSLTALGQANAALAAFDRATQHLPESGAVRTNRGNLLKEWGRLKAATADLQRAVELSPRFMGAHTNLLLASNHLAHASPAQSLAQAREFGRWAMAQAGPPLRPGPRTSAGPLRVGLISGDLRHHPVGFFARSLFAHLPAQGIELLAYATVAREDALTQQLKQGAQRWRSLPPEPQAAARLIAADEPDILIDLAGHTAHNGLDVMAWRPAPVQATWLGYFATTGLPTMDWLIADDWSVRPEDEACFSERIARLPDTRLCYAPPDDAPVVAPSPSSEGRPFCFGSFQPLGKYNAPVLDLWAKTLLAVPGSVLRLQQAFFADPKVCADMCSAFATRGVNPERLQLHAKTSMRDYLKAYGLVDVVLDTFPFPGGTTTCEALWMGVPTLTLPGHSLISRQGSGLMRAAGLGGWVAEDEADWLRKAIHWSQSMEDLGQLRAGLREQLAASALMDGPRFAKAFARLLRGLISAD